MARLKITQTRSGIGRKDNQRQTLRSLGLKRLHDVVVKEDRPEIRGMVQAVRHLVTVEDRRQLPPRPLSEVQEEIRNKLAGESMAKEREHYLSQLRKTAQIDQKL